MTKPTLQRIYPENDCRPTHPENECPACNRGEILRKLPGDGFEVADGKWSLRFWPHLPSLLICLKFIPPEVVSQWNKTGVQPRILG
jgi:hypothetical protein